MNNKVTRKMHFSDRKFHSKPEKFVAKIAYMQH